MTDGVSDAKTATVVEAKPPPPLRDTICLGIIGVLALADLLAIGYYKVPVDAVSAVSVPVLTGLLAFLKGS